MSDIDTMTPLVDGGVWPADPPTTDRVSADGDERFAELDATLQSAIMSITGAPLPTSATAPRQPHRSLGRRVKPSAAPQAAVPPGHPIDAVRQDLLRVIATEVLPDVQAQRAGVCGLIASPGVGKTRAMAMAMAHLLRSPQCTSRMLFLTSTRHNATEVAHRYFSDQQTGALLPGVAIAYPRTETSGPGYCANHALARRYGAQRQNVVQTICRACGSRPGCPYLDHHAALRAARLVIGTHEAYLQGGTDALGGFDLVVIDEFAIDALVETITIGIDDVREWEAGAIHAPCREQALRVLSAVKRALVAGPSEGVVLGTDGGFLLPLLRRLEPAIDQYLADLQQHLPTTDQTTGIDVAPGGRQGLPDAPPLRALTDLVDLLVEEAAAGDPAATACWLLPAMGTRPQQVRLLRPRSEVIAMLRTRTTVFLDATLPAALLDALFDGQFQVREFRAETFTEVTLFMDSTYHLATGAPDGWDLQACERLLAVYCHSFTRPLVVCQKEAQQRLRVPPHAAVTHYGAADAVGSNAYENCDAVVLIGRHRTPDGDHVRMT